MESAVPPTPFVQLSSNEAPQSEFTWTYPPFAPDTGKMWMVPPPETCPAAPPLQSGLRATSELEFEFAASFDATASVLTVAVSLPKIRPKNDGWSAVMMTCTLPGWPE